jgi:RNA 2',3'-cyclic 3'-phosphodiesterase
MGQEQTAGSEVIRSFMAIEIGDDVRRSLARFQDQLRKTDAHVGWVAPANIHVTLVFLGDIFASQVAPLSAAMDEIGTACAPFPLEVTGTGTFGSARSPRVIWAGIRDDGARLPALYERLAGAVRGLGLHVEDRPFKAHLTLGRVRSSRGADGLTSVVASANNTSFGFVKVERILLMQSHLEHQGVRYSVLHASALQGA